MADDIVTRLRHPELPCKCVDVVRLECQVCNARLDAAELIEAQQTEIKRLRAAGDAMAEWLCLDVAHYEECATMHSDWPEVCNCGADKLRRAWGEARRG